MIQPQSKLTIVLKIYSVLALLLAVYKSVTYVLAYIKIELMPMLIVINNAEVLVSVAVIGLLIWMIYTNKAASALFIPCLILGLVYGLTLLGYIENYISLLRSHETFTIWPILLWYAANTAVYLLIAIDTRSGPRFALAELLTVLALTVLRVIAAVVDAVRIPIEFYTAKLVFQTLLNTLIIVISPAVVIALLLLRTHLLRKRMRL
jgi:hypothetical protein